MREEPRTVIPRLLAGTSGLALAVLAAASWYLAQLVRGLVDDGHALVTGASTSASVMVEQSTEGMQTEAGLLAASSAERFAHDLIGDAGTAVQRFQVLLLVSLFAGALAIAVALRRLPLQRWPEFAWAAAAVLALLPAVMLQLWLVIAIPTAACFALAAGLHLTRRHDLTLARGRPPPEARSPRRPRPCRSAAPTRRRASSRRAANSSRPRASTPSRSAAPARHWPSGRPRSRRRRSAGSAAAATPDSGLCGPCVWA